MEHIFSLSSVFQERRLLHKLGVLPAFPEGKDVGKRLSALRSEIQVAQEKLNNGEEEAEELIEAIHNNIAVLIRGAIGMGLVPASKQKDFLQRISEVDIFRLSFGELRKHITALKRAVNFLSGELQDIKQELHIHKQRIADVIIQYGRILGSEIALLKKWKNNVPLTGSEEKSVLILQQKFVGTGGTDGIGQKALDDLQKNAALSDQQYLKEWGKISAAIINILFLLGMEEGFSYQAERIQQSENDERMVRIARSRKHFVVRIIEDHEFDVEDEDFDLRGVLREAKKKLLFFKKDSRVSEMAEWIKNKGPKSAEHNAQVRQHLTDIFAETGEYSFSSLEKHVMGWRKSLQGMRGENRQYKLESLLSTSEAEYVLFHMALYELAVSIKEQMIYQEGKKRGLFSSSYMKRQEDLSIQEQKAFDDLDERLFQDAHDVREGVGFVLSYDSLRKLSGGKIGDTFDYKNGGGVAHNALTPHGLATLYILGYGGMLTAAFNIMVFLQDRKNTLALAYAAGGITALYFGGEMLKKNSVDSFFHPERELSNTLSFLAQSTEGRKILYEFHRNIRFYKQIDLLKGESLFRNTMEMRKKEEEMQRESRRKDAKMKGDFIPPEEKYRYTVWKKDFLEEGVLSDILLPGYDKTVVANMYDTQEIAETRYKTLDWLFENNIANERLFEVAKLSQRVLQAKGMETAFSRIVPGVG
jgi:hypothetical protein